MAESDTIDELDLQVLHALQIDGRAPFSRIAGVLGVSDQTIARRFRRLSSVMNLRVVGVRDAELLGRDSWMLRLRVGPDAAVAVAHTLARRRDTSWIGITSAGTEVVCTISSAAAGNHEELILDKLPRTPGVTDIRAHQVLHRFFGGPDGWFGKGTPLDAELLAALTPAWESGSEPAPPLGREALDAADEALLQTLERDGRAPPAHLARASGLSESAVRRRLDRLLRSGGLYIDAEFSSDVIGYATRAMLWLTVEPRCLEGVGRALARRPEAAAVNATSGGSNLMAVVVCRGVAEIYGFLSGAVGSLDGVRHAEISPVLRSVKQLTYDGDARRHPGA